MKKKKVIFDNKQYDSLTKLCEYYNMDYDVFSFRIKNGWSWDDALNTPIDKRHKGNSKKIIVLGQAFNSKKEAREFYGISKNTFDGRIRSGWDLEKAITTPVGQYSEDWVKPRKKYEDYSQICIENDLYVDPNGKYFNSFKEMCSYWWQIDTSVLIKLKKELTLKQCLSPTPRSFGEELIMSYLLFEKKYELMNDGESDNYRFTMNKTIGFLEDKGVLLDIKNFVGAKSEKIKEDNYYFDYKDILKLQFDFVIIKDFQIVAIFEFNGEQHYKQSKGWNYTENDEQFLKSKVSEKRKRQICEFYNIPFFVIKDKYKYDKEKIRVLDSEEILNKLDDILTRLQTQTGYW